MKLNLAEFEARHGVVVEYGDVPWPLHHARIFWVVMTRNGRELLASLTYWGKLTEEAALRFCESVIIQRA